MPRHQDALAPADTGTARSRRRQAAAPRTAGEASIAPAVPRFAALYAILTYAAATLALGWPALLGRFLVNPHSDEYIAGYAFREYGASMLKHAGHFPQWNPYLFGGLPFIAAMHGDIFYFPAVLLRLILPVDVAMTWGFLIHVFLAGAFTYGFLRAARFGFGPSLVGGLAYMMSGAVAGLVSPGHDGKLYVSALMPAALWLITIGVRDGRDRAWGLLSLVVGLAVLSPHPQALQYLLLVGGFYGLYVAFWGPEEWRPERRVAIRRLACALGAVVLGGLIGAIQYLPVREYVAWSPRATGIGWERATSYSMPPEELINAYLPQFSGILDRYWGRNGIHFHSDYIGAVSLVLFGLAFLAKGPRERRWKWFWLGTFVISLLWSLGGYTPFFHLVYAIVPGTKFFRAPSVMLFVVSFAVAMLAALGTQVLLAREYGRKYLIGWGIAALAIALLASAGAFTNLATTLTNPQIPDALDRVEANAGAVVAGAWRSLLFVFLACGALWLWLDGRIDRRIALWAVAVILAADLWSIERDYWIFSPPASVLYASDPAIDYLKKLDQPVRVLSLPPAQGGAPAVPHDPELGYDALMTHRIRETLGYHGNELGRYQQLYDHEGDMVQRVVGDPNFWQLTNTQYFLTNLEQPVVPGMTRVLGPVKDAAGSTIYLYRFPGEQPFAWVTPVAVKAPDDATLATVVDPRFNVKSVALFDTAARVAAVPAQSLTAMPTPLAITPRATTYEPGHIVLELDQPAPRNAALVVSENYYVGWHAKVDGRDAPIGRADMTLIGVSLPAGARKIELTFQDPAYTTGKTLTIAAIALSLLLFALGFVFDGRARRG